MMKMMKPALVCFLMMTLICGVIYTGVVTGFGQLFFNHKANGSIVTVQFPYSSTGEVGSLLIAQTFSQPGYLIGRPSEVSNLSPFNGDQKKKVEERIKDFQHFNSSKGSKVPMDLVTASGSGVDPHISVEAAEYQVGRIAKFREIPEEKVREAIRKSTNNRFLNFWGEPGVNVLEVNLRLDGLR